MHWYDNRFQGFVKYAEIDETVRQKKSKYILWLFFFIINTLLELLLYHQYDLYLFS